MRIALVKDNIVDNVIVAEPEFELEGFLSIPVEDMTVDIGDTLYYEGVELIHQKKEVVKPLSEVEILQKELAEQKALINAMLGVVE